MKTIIAAVISIAFLMGAPVFLMEKQQSAFAISTYQSGFQHGVSDGKIVVYIQMDATGIF